MGDGRDVYSIIRGHERNLHEHVINGSARVNPLAQVVPEGAQKRYQPSLTDSASRVLNPTVQRHVNERKV